MRNTIRNLVERLDREAEAERTTKDAALRDLLEKELCKAIKNNYERLYTGFVISVNVFEDHVDSIYPRNTDMNKKWTLSFMEKILGELLGDMFSIKYQPAIGRSDVDQYVIQRLK